MGAAANARRPARRAGRALRGPRGQPPGGRSEPDRLRAGGARESPPQAAGGPPDAACAQHHGPFPRGRETELLRVDDHVGPRQRAAGSRKAQPQLVGSFTAAPRRRATAGPRVAGPPRARRRGRAARLGAPEIGHWSLLLAKTAACSFVPTPGNRRTRVARLSSLTVASALTSFSSPNSSRRRVAQLAIDSPGWRQTVDSHEAASHISVERTGAMSCTSLFRLTNDAFTPAIVAAPSSSQVRRPWCLSSRTAS